jgi:glycosyltransferase involved in cell wall biosynthesis
MRICVNALSATAPSGQHVLFGHVRQLARWTLGEHEFHILCCPRTRPDDDDMGPNVFWHPASQAVGAWWRRALWEFHTLPRWMSRQRMDLYFTPTGTILPRSTVPQISLAQNPWCLTAAVPKTLRERVKASVQRSAYRAAQRSADVMVYNSNHMLKLYSRNAGGRCAQRSLVAYQGIHDSTHELARQTRDPSAKDSDTILCVSVMARWKNCETLLHALRAVRERRVPARLRLLGSWPDSRYRQEIDATIDRLGLNDVVQIEGFVSLADLHAAYRSARVFCLLSRCESFGIPAVEAQAFGTPVVGSNTCAMPEIGGSGGDYVSPDEAGSVADVLERLLTDHSYWSHRSDEAIKNAARFRWEECSRPLLEMLANIGAENRIEKVSCVTASPARSANS